MRIKEIIGTRSIASTGRRAFAPSIEYAPSIRDRLLWVAPLRDNAQSLYDNGVVAYVDPSAQIVGPDGTYIDSYRIMQEAIEDVLRIESNGARLEGLNINDLIRSNDFDTAWIKTNSISVTPNTDIAPDGTLTADTLTDPGSTGSACYHNVNATDGLEYCHFVHIKKTGTKTYRPVIYAQDLASGNQFYAVSLNTETGATTEMTSGTFLTPDGFGAISVGDYWLVWIVMTQAGTGTLRTLVYPAWALESAPATHDNTLTGSNVFWGAQRTQSAFPVRYIPTEGSAVTRVADVLKFATAGNILPASGTFQIAFTPDWDATSAGGDRYLFHCLGGVGSGGFFLFWDHSESNFSALFYNNNSVKARIDAPDGVVRGEQIVLTLRWEEDNFKINKDAALGETDISGSAPNDVPDDMVIGAKNDGTSPAPGNYSHAALWDQVFSDDDVTSSVAEIQGWAA